MIQRDQGEGAESPEDEGVREAGQRALADDFGLAETSQKKSQMRLPTGARLEVGILAGRKDVPQDPVEAGEEAGRESPISSASSTISQVENDGGSA